MGGRLFIKELAVLGVGFGEDSVALVFTLKLGGALRSGLLVREFERGPRGEGGDQPGRGYHWVSPFEIR